MFLAAVLAAVLTGGLAQAPATYDAVVDRGPRAEPTLVKPGGAGSSFNDPVFRSLSPLTTYSSRRRTILVFHDRGPGQRVDRLSVGRFDYDGLFSVVRTGNDEQWKGLRALVEEALEELELWPQLAGQRDSARYALVEMGGKRIRPVISLAVGEALEAPPEQVMPSALALELVHTFSLVHDDLPALEARLSHGDVAAFLVEPVQGEGGMRVPSAGYLGAASEICKRYGTLFMLDEIQTGLGRTGTLFAAEQEIGLAPDEWGGKTMVVPVSARLKQGIDDLLEARKTLVQEMGGTLVTVAKDVKLQVEFDPAQVSYEQLLAIFWSNHDPTTRDRQGPDIGSQYRSVVFCHSPEQKAAAEAKKAELDSTKSDVSFGSQIRSYVFQPYTMVNDHRTELKIPDVQKVMDGGIDPFIEAFLKLTGGSPAAAGASA